MSVGVIAALLGGSILLFAVLLLSIIVVLGRRARAGRLAGRYTSRPGNSSDNSSSSLGGG
ncbi:hypothetical protein [Micromonospora sp. CV4]|uniref:hypothetical protein n=1 Tax=Micromonospora sp. CV4 TaxID=2478711 RepID=UPI0011C3E513|nr:hypothetical protein [Micromonospora sp. CV4]